MIPIPSDMRGAAPSVRDRVGAVVVTYNPDIERLGDVLATVARQACECVVVDNASSNRAEILDLLGGHPSVRMEPLEKNMGMGAALNVGVAQLRRAGREWILTLDQDTVVHEGAVARLLADFEELDPAVKDSCAVIAMSRHKPKPVGRRRQWVEQSLLVEELEGNYRSIASAITSGNLVRASIFDKVRYNEEFFMDQIDTLFCADLRRAGGTILEYREPTMDHRLGATVMTKRGPRVYEGGIRLYYISRNAFSLVLREHLPVRVFLRDIIGLSRSYVAAHGRRSMLRCSHMVLAGLRDGALKRFGPRNDDLSRVK